ncbi:helix-turn-helix domain-containing protein [Haladaptatus salinisoli]|uniref:helix-turn-helix domain-containing protein n=1 Tax=Haladaptatus salinisoli TaxID=2884876 RepID=UPI001D0BB104|nr:helix-turn-helix domain-containing protein [Haladaptatus salinisoli]
MIIVEFTLDHPILRETLERVPDMELAWERSDPVEDRIRVLLWAHGGDFDAFEDALEADPTVTTPLQVIEVGDRRLYQLELIGEGRQTSIYPILIEEGGVIHNLIATHDGWKFRVAFPDRNSFQQFYYFCHEHRITMDVDRIYEQRSDSIDSIPGLTEIQRETLVTAVDCGYFEIPRESSLAELAARLGISENAASERIRRGVNRLITEILKSDRE